MATEEMRLALKLLAVDQTKAAFGSLNQSLNGLKSTVLTVAGVVTSALAFREVLDSLKRAGEGLNRLQDEFGFTARQASLLDGIARSVGLSNEALATSLANVQKKMVSEVEAIMLGTSTFDKFGVKVKTATGELLAGEPLLAELNRAFREMPQGVVRTTAAMELMGKGGREMLDFLTLAPDQIAETTRFLEEMGLVMDEQGADALAKLRRDLFQFDLQLEGIKLAIGQALLPMLRGLLLWLRQNAGAFKALGEAIRHPLGLVKSIADAIATFLGRFKEDFGAAVLRLGEDLKDILLDALSAIGTKLDELGPLGTLAKDALLLIGGVNVLSALQNTVLGIRNIGTALRNLPARTVLLIDVVLVGIALNEVKDTVELIRGNWGKFVLASTDPRFDNLPITSGFIKLVVVIAEAIDKIRDLLALLPQLPEPLFGAGPTPGRGGAQPQPAPGPGPAGGRGGFVQPGTELPGARTIRVGGQFFTPGEFANLFPGVKPVAQPFQAGGIVTRPTLGLLGERGPEAVVPLSRGGGFGNITIHVHGNVDGRETVRRLADEVSREILRAFSMGGNWTFRRSGGLA